MASKLGKRRGPSRSLTLPRRWRSVPPRSRAARAGCSAPSRSAAAFTRATWPPCLTWWAPWSRPTYQALSGSPSGELVRVRGEAWWAPRV